MPHVHKHCEYLLEKQFTMYTKTALLQKGVALLKMASAKVVKSKRVAKKWLW